MSAESVVLEEVLRRALDDALDIRRRILSAFERAEATDDPEERKALLTFAIVGGGPTGVELAGTMAEIARHTLNHEFRHIDPSHARVMLLEAGPRVPPDPRSIWLIRPDGYVATVAAVDLAGNVFATASFPLTVIAVVRTSDDAGHLAGTGSSGAWCW